MYNAEIGVGCNSVSDGCASSDCPRIPDFCIKRYDSRPYLKVSMEDCDGVVDLTDPNLVLEANMWFSAKLKSPVSVSSSSFSFADNLGFDKVLVGDVVVMDRTRNPERMLVSAIDEAAKTVTVQRAYGGTVAQAWPRGSAMRVFRFMNAQSTIESLYGEVTSLDGTVTNELLETFLVFEWGGNTTSMPGCYWLEFKLMMLNASSIEWSKRMPLSGEGFLVNIVDSPTAEI
jgi:hypothetical protein